MNQSLHKMYHFWHIKGVALGRVSAQQVLPIPQVVSASEGIWSLSRTRLMFARSTHVLLWGSCILHQHLKKQVKFAFVDSLGPSEKQLKICNCKHFTFSPHNIRNHSNGIVVTFRWWNLIVLKPWRILEVTEQLKVLVERIHNSHHFKWHVSYDEHSIILKTPVLLSYYYPELNFSFMIMLFMSIAL